MEYGWLAQMAAQRIFNPWVAGSIPVLSTTGFCRAFMSLLSLLMGHDGCAGTTALGNRAGENPAFITICV